MRLIDADALKKAVQDYANDQYDAGEYIGEYTILSLIDNAPAVEPLERIGSICDENCGYHRPQGEWINHRNDYGHNIADCSLCGKAMQWHDEDEDGIPRYCWYCGAKMKEGAE